MVFISKASGGACQMIHFQAAWRARHPIIKGLQAWRWAGEWRQVRKVLHHWHVTKRSGNIQLGGTVDAWTAWGTVIIETHLFYHHMDTAVREVVFNSLVFKSFILKHKISSHDKQIWQVWLSSGPKLPRSGLRSMVIVWIKTTSWLWLGKQYGLGENGSFVKARRPLSSWLD